jgi:hypothetical protein
MFIYSIYGITFSTTLSFCSPLPSSTNSPILHIGTQNGVLPLDDAIPLTTLPTEYWNLAAPKAVYRLNDQDILQFPRGDQIVIQPQEISYHHGGQHKIYLDLMDIRLLGSGFAWWLLRQGKIPFHAGSVVVDGQAILFSAESGTGKSTLMCSLLSQGIGLHCDDFVTVHLSEAEQKILASSAYPQMRLWPASIEQFIGSPDQYPSVFHGGRKRRVPVGEKWGTFLPGTFPVSRIYLLERREDEEGPITLEKYQGHAAFMQLLAAMTMGCFFPLNDFEAIWSIIEEFANQVPVYQLSYPSGWQWLPAVKEAILNPSL